MFRCQEAHDLSALLSTSTSGDFPTLPGREKKRRFGVSGGLPPPRWARSAYDRGLEEVNDFLDLLWGFRGDESDETTWNGASKHFLLTSAEIKEDVVPLGGAFGSS